jgi:hypothetical protein
VSAFNARFPGRPAQPTHTNPQPVVFNVNIFDASPPETSAATETKVSSIESLHRYAQYTGRYPKLGLFDYPEEAEDEDAGVDEDGMDQESGLHYPSEVEGEEEPLHQDIPVHEGYDAGGRGQPRAAEFHGEETHHEPPTERSRSKSAPLHM